MFVLSPHLECLLARRSLFCVELPILPALLRFKVITSRELCHVFFICADICTIIIAMPLMLQKWSNWREIRPSARAEAANNFRQSLVRECILQVTMHTDAIGCSLLSYHQEIFSLHPGRGEECCFLSSHSVFDGCGQSHSCVGRLILPV